MTNAEKFREEIENFKGDFCGDFVRPKVLKRGTCDGMGCVQCRMIQMMWLMDEYKEPEEPKVDWSKVEVDTPILVRDLKSEGWYRRHFAKYENGKVYAWVNGNTSWSRTWELAADAMVGWEFAKLAAKEKETERILMTAWGYEKLAGEGDE